MNIKKILISCLAITLTGSIMSQKIPAYTLAVFEIGEKTYYLKSVELSDFKKHKISEENSGGFYLEYRVICGNFPESYDVADFILHAIPQDSIYKLESKLFISNSYEGKKDGDVAWGKKAFTFKGYSNDENLLEAKILEYYLENVKNKTDD